MSGKPPLRVLSPIYPPYTSIEHNRFSGPVRDMVEEMWYYFVQKFNITWIPFQVIGTVQCSLADCPSILPSLQQDKADFYPWSSHRLERYKNISLGGIRSVNSCHFWTRSRKLLAKKYNQFGDYLAEVDGSTLFLIVWMTFLPLCLVTILKRKSFLSTIYYAWGMLFHRCSSDYTRLEELTLSRTAVTSAALYAFLVQTILLSQFQYGLITEQDAGKVMVYEDLKRLGVSLEGLSFSQCLPVLKAMNGYHHVDGREELTDILKFLNSESLPLFVSLIDRHEEKFFVEYGCHMPMDKVRLCNYYFSPKITEFVANILTSSRTPRRSFDTLNKAAGSHFEMGMDSRTGFHYSRMVRRLAGEPSELRCVQDLYKKNEKEANPIALVYFRNNFLCFAIVVLLSIICFGVEIIIFS